MYQSSLIKDFQLIFCDVSEPEPLAQDSELLGCRSMPFRSRNEFRSIHQPRQEMNADIEGKWIEEADTLFFYFNWRQFSDTHLEGGGTERWKGSRGGREDRTAAL